MASYLASRSVTLGFGADDVAPGSAQRSTRLVNLSHSLLAELARLTEEPDSPSFDMGETLSRLVDALSRSLPSFIGLSMLLGDPQNQVEVTTLEDTSQAPQIRASLRFPLDTQEPQGSVQPPSGVLIVYAGQSGALVDLAADLAWLTGRPLSDARLDVDLAGPDGASRGRSLSRLSTIDQALGVLMSGGLTPEEAGDELDDRAARTGAQRYVAATEVLALLPGSDAISAEESS